MSNWWIVNTLQNLINLIVKTKDTNMTQTLEQELRYTITNKSTGEKFFMATLPSKRSIFRKPGFVIFDNLSHRNVK